MIANYFDHIDDKSYLSQLSLICYKELVFIFIFNFLLIFSSIPFWKNLNALVVLCNVTFFARNRFNKHIMHYIKEDIT